MKYTQFDTSHIEDAISLWQSHDGIGLSGSDSSDQLAAFLERNPGFSFIALNDDSLIGTILCGHDGRRGYIYHLAVADAFRRQGIARTLLDRSLFQLRQNNILKCHAFVFKSNPYAELFWGQNGWQRRDDLIAYSSELVDESARN